jgi:hypothetical protein
MQAARACGQRISTARVFLADRYASSNMTRFFASPALADANGRVSQAARFIGVTMKR